MPTFAKITPCLWFDRQAEEAATFYTSIFPDSRILSVSRYGEAGREVHGMPAGTVMTVSYELAGHGFTALNGGPIFKFNEAISLQVHCEDQAEIDYYWEHLTAGADEKAQQCGWLKDRFGVSWQVTSPAMTALLNDPDRAGAARAMNAMLRMKKIDLDAMRRAARGE
ncbi:MAG TPA: VOC family protein [Gemmatimonadaceae bacterium]|nr:VOC family protein [Gemmatimonadaceae bacterium]